MLHALARKPLYPAFRFHLRGIRIPKFPTPDKGSYYYVIPEIPPDSPSTNSLLKLDSFPCLKDIRPEQAFTGVSRLIIDYQVALSKLSEKLKSGQIYKNGKCILREIESASYPIDRALNMVKAATLMHFSPSLGIITSRLLSKYVTARYDHLCSDSEIYRALCLIKAENKDCTDEELSFVQLLLGDSWVSGTDLISLASGFSLPSVEAIYTHPSLLQHGGTNNSGPVAKFRHDVTSPSSHDKADLDHDAQNLYLHDRPSKASLAQKRLALLREEENRLRMSEHEFQQVAFDGILAVADSASDSSAFHGQISLVEDDLAPSTPSWLPKLLETKLETDRNTGLEKVVMRVNLLFDQGVAAVLQNCNNSPLRYSIWTSWLTRGSRHQLGSRTGHLFPNDKVIPRLRISRARIAHQLGSRDALACVWHSGYSRAPRSPRYLADYVLEPMRAQLYPIGQAEWELLKEWGPQHLGLANVNPWDVSYAIRQYNYNAGLEHAASRLLPGQVAKHYEVHREFAFPDIPDRLFARLAAPFGFRVTRITDSAQLPISLQQLIFSRCDNVSAPRSKGSVVSEFELNRMLVYRVEDDLSPQMRPGHILFDIVDRPSRNFKMHSGFEVMPLVSSPQPGRDSTEGPLVAMLSGLPVNVATEGLTSRELYALANGFGQCLQHVTSHVSNYLLRDPNIWSSPDSLPAVGDLFAELLLTELNDPGLTGDLLLDAYSPEPLQSTNSDPSVHNPVSRESDEPDILSRQRVSQLLPSFLRCLNATKSSLPVTPQSSNLTGILNSTSIGTTSTIPSANSVTRILALPMLRALYESSFDLALWSEEHSNKPWRSISSNLWLAHMPYQLDLKEEFWPCSAFALFSHGSQPGWRYANVWRAVVAADCLAAFREAALHKDPSLIRDTFKRYRDCYLLSGNVVPHCKKFHLFRGRDPIPDHLLHSLLHPELSGRAVLSPLIDQPLSGFISNMI